MSSPGLYDSIRDGFLENKAEAVRTAIAFDFDLHSIPFYAEDERSRTLLPPKSDSGASSERWYERLHCKGVAANEIAFLFQVLNPNPTERWTAKDILSCGFLEVN